MITVNTDTWQVLQQLLGADENSGAGYIQAHLPEMRAVIEQSPTGEVLIIPDPNDPNEILALAGITQACSIVTVHFFYLTPGENIVAFSALTREIIEAGRKHFYSYVLVKCPIMTELKSLQLLLASIAVNQAEEPTSSDTRIVKYLVPKDEWERVF